MFHRLFPVSKTTYSVSSGMLNSAHLFTDFSNNSAGSTNMSYLRKYSKCIFGRCHNHKKSTHWTNHIGARLGITESEKQTNGRVKVDVTNFSASKHRLKAVHFTILLSVITTAADDCCVCGVIATHDSVTCVIRWLNSNTACLLSTMSTQSDNISIQLGTSVPLLTIIIQIQSAH